MSLIIISEQLAIIAGIHHIGRNLTNFDSVQK